MSDETKAFVTRLARGVTVGIAHGLGVALTADQTIELYQRIRDGIAEVLGETLEDLAACDELEDGQG